MMYKVFLFDDCVYQIIWCNYDATEREQGEQVVSIWDNKELADEVCEALNEAYQRGLRDGRS